jgi:PAS domain-containing protein
MKITRIDYISVFQHLSTPALIMSSDFVMLDVNLAYLRISDRKREDLIGQSVFTAFPDNPGEPGTSGPGRLGDSLRRVVATGEAEAMPVQRYDVETRTGTFEERYWCPVNIPVPDQEGQVALILHVVDEVPELIRKFVAAEAAST